MQQDRLPWLVSMTKRGMLSSRGELTSSTSAPCSARVRPLVGPASRRLRSSTRTPSSGRRVPPGRLGGALPDLLDADPAQRGDGGRLWVRRPLAGGTGHGAARSRLRQGVLERLPVPEGDPLGHEVGRALHAAAEDVTGQGGQVRERAVQVHPSAVTAAVQPHERAVQAARSDRHLVPIQLLEQEPDEGRARVAPVDGDRLRLSGTLLPQQ